MEFLRPVIFVVQVMSDIDKQEHIHDTGIPQSVPN